RYTSQCLKLLREHGRQRSETRRDAVELRCIQIRRLAAGGWDRLPVDEESAPSLQDVAVLEHGVGNGQAVEIGAIARACVLDHPPAQSPREAQMSRGHPRVHHLQAQQTLLRAIPSAIEQSTPRPSTERPTARDSAGGSPDDYRLDIGERVARRWKQWTIALECQKE